MTQKVNPSAFRPAEAFKTAGAISLGGGSSDGWISSPSDPSYISSQDSGIDETVLDGFSESHTSSSLDVTINAGEAFVSGSWLVKDTSTTVSLSASTTGQIVYVGWDKDSTNAVTIGLSSAFANTASDTDKRIPLWSFDTDSTGVTSVDDRRTMGQRLTAEQVSILRTIDSDSRIRILSDRGMVASGPMTVNGELEVNGSFTDTIGPITGTGSVSGSGTVKVID